MIVSSSRIEHALEIFGPRNQVWRPAGPIFGILLREAVILAATGRCQEAINRAEELWVAQNEHMHDVRFRVATTEHKVTAASPLDLLDDPLKVLNACEARTPA